MQPVSGINMYSTVKVNVSNYQQKEPASPTKIYFCMDFFCGGGGGVMVYGIGVTPRWKGTTGLFQPIFHPGTYQYHTEGRRANC